MKRLLSVLLTIAMLLSLVTVSAMAEEKELLTIDVYDDAANYNGIQSGWFAKLIKDKFNIELNIIASQVVGNTIYATRSEEGNLGDILVVDKSKFPEIVEAGLARDISDKLPECKNIMVFKNQIDVYNKGLTGEEGKYYGIPTEMTDTSPTTLTDDVIYSSPMLRWDLYNQIGAPKLENLDDLLAALVKIHEIHPVNEQNDPAYPFSLWPDWDNNDNMSGPANVVQLTTWYGQKLKGSAMLMPDNTFKKLYERDSAYYTITKFLNKANQLGLVDPDSGTQNWDNACAKMSSGRVDVMWYSWQVGFWNSVDRLNAGTAFRFIPVGDQTYYADADRYFGSDRMFGIGSKVEGEKYDRIMEFLDWYASPEGVTFQHDGIEGLNYTVENGKFVPYKDNALMDNLPVPDEFGGGGFSDGNNAINQWIVSALCVNPITGERFAQKYWQSYKDMTMTQMKKEWAEMFGAEDDVAWMKANGKLLASPSVDFAPAADNNDIAALRADVNKCLCEYTWNLIMTCATDEEFEAMWDEMITQLDGFGYQELFDYDCALWQPEVDAKIAAAAAAE